MESWTHTWSNHWQADRPELCNDSSFISDIDAWVNWWNIRNITFQIIINFNFEYFRKSNFISCNAMKWTGVELNAFTVIVTNCRHVTPSICVHINLFPLPPAIFYVCVCVFHVPAGFMHVMLWFDGRWTVWFIRAISMLVFRSIRFILQLCCNFSFVLCIRNAPKVFSVCVHKSRDERRTEKCNHAQGENQSGKLIDTCN